MPAFEYLALDIQGQRQMGVLQADSVQQARQSLLQKSLYPVEVMSSSEAQLKTTFSLRWFRRLRSTELIDFTRQLALLIEAGVPLDEALSAVGQQDSRKRIEKISQTLLASIREGVSFSDALRRLDYGFDSMYLAMVSAGEQSGQLAAVLLRLADHLEQRQALEDKLRQSLAYPCVLCVVSILMVIFLLTYVVPEIVSQFERTDQLLPWSTRLLIGLSEGVKDYFILWISFAGVMVWLVRWFLKTHRSKLDAYFINTALTGKWLVEYDLARFSRAMSIMLSSGITLVDAMKLASLTVNNCVLQQQLLDVSQQVEEGRGLADSLQNIPFLPPLISCLLHSGEQSGGLNEMFSRIADRLESTGQKRLQRAVTLFEPLVILLLGGVVLFIVLATLLPILELNNLAML